MQTVSNSVPSSFSLLDVGNKTANHAQGQQDFSRLTIAVMKLGYAIFPSYRVVFEPVVQYLTHHQHVAGTFTIFSVIEKWRTTEKRTICTALKFFNPILSTYHLLSDTNLIQLSTWIKVSHSTGSITTLEPSSFHRMAQFTQMHFKHVFTAATASIVIGIILVQCYRASSLEEKQKACSQEKMLILVQQTGRLTVACIGMIGYQSPILMACIHLTIAASGYVKFLISHPK